MVAFSSDSFNNNRSRRSSTDQETLSSSNINNSVSDTATLLSNMHITLPDSRIFSPKVRRSPVTPPSVTPPSVSTDISSIQIQQLERDRCKSPSQRTASALLAKVAVLPFVPSATAPMATSSGMCSPGLTSSNSSTPASSSPGEGDQFSFGSFPKSLPASPNGGYVSFPDFDQFGDCNSDDEDTQMKH